MHIGCHVSEFVCSRYARDSVSATTAQRPGVYFSSTSNDCKVSMNLWILEGDFISGFENIW